MQYTYPLEWLDVVITVVLNPNSTDVSLITAEQCQGICSRLAEENTCLQLLISSQVFEAAHEQEAQLLIRRYHSALIILLDQNLENQKTDLATLDFLKETYNAISCCLDGLLSFMETRFHGCLGLDERVPATYLMVSCKELQKRLGKLSEKIKAAPGAGPALEVVLERLQDFINGIQKPEEITFGDVLYKKELVKQLEEINWSPPESCVYSPLEETLVYLNFNSKTFMNLLTGRLAEKINICKEPAEKLERLLFYHKAFNQLHRKPGIAYNPRYHDLETVIGNWFSQEIAYLEKSLALPPAVTIPDEREKEAAATAMQKITCQLSTDQTGLILRAADEARVLVARSMSEVFRSIVPYLATPNRENLSYKSVRSKSYNPEERDKEIAIATLEKMIKKIKEY